MGTLISSTLKVASTFYSVHICINGVDLTSYLTMNQLLQLLTMNQAHYFRRHHSMLMTSLINTLVNVFLMRTRLKTYIKSLTLEYQTYEYQT